MTKELAEAAEWASQRPESVDRGKFITLDILSMGKPLYTRVNTALQPCRKWDVFRIWGPHNFTTHIGGKLIPLKVEPGCSINGKEARPFKEVAFPSKSVITVNGVGDFVFVQEIKQAGNE